MNKSTESHNKSNSKNNDEYKNISSSDEPMWNEKRTHTFLKKLKSSAKIKIKMPIIHE
jgi:hypothetical protein